MRSGMQLTAAFAFVSIWAEAAVITEAAVVIPLTGQVVSAVNPEDHSLTKSPVYYGEVLVGQSKRSFQVLLDTGSSNLWLPSTSCSAVPCDLHRKYQPMRMANESEEADGLATSFATGQLVGFAVKDSFCLADLCARGSIMAAVQESYYPFTAMPFDGILGLGPTHDASSPLRALAEVGLDRFAFRLEAPIGGVNGEAAFGALPTHWINGPTEWVPLVPEAEEEGYWLVEVLAVSVGGRVLQNCTRMSEGCRAAVDTGSGDIMGPKDIVNHLLAILAVKEDCSLTDLAPVHFQLRGEGRTVTLTLEPVDYVDWSEGFCEVSISSVEMPLEKPQLWVLGHPLLRRYVSAYDLPQRRVGFTRAARTAAAADAVAAAGAEMAKARARAKRQVFYLEAEARLTAQEIKRELLSKAASARAAGVQGRGRGGLRKELTVAVTIELARRDRAEEQGLRKGQVGGGLRRKLRASVVPAMGKFKSLPKVKRLAEEKTKQRVVVPAPQGAVTVTSDCAGTRKSWAAAAATYTNAQIDTLPKMGADEQSLPASWASAARRRGPRQDGTRSVATCLTRHQPRTAGAHACSSAALCAETIGCAVSHAFCDRIDRALMQRLYLLQMQRQDGGRGATFKVLGSTGNVYTVDFGIRPGCDCPDFLKGRGLCKHVLFIWLRVLRVPEDLRKSNAGQSAQGI
ncbi:unnamed protein product [Effrenium voratum]|nr:unnamed protein product [Effrenium voratum]